MSRNAWQKTLCAHIQWYTDSAYVICSYLLSVSAKLYILVMAHVHGAGDGGNVVCRCVSIAAILLPSHITPHHASPLRPFSTYVREDCIAHFQMTIDLQKGESNRCLVSNTTKLPAAPPDEHKSQLKRVNDYCNNAVKC